MLAAPHHYLISIQRGGVALVAVCMQEVAPLFVIEFLHRVVDTFQVSELYGRGPILGQLYASDAGTAQTRLN